MIAILVIVLYSLLGLLIYSIIHNTAKTATLVTVSDDNKYRSNCLLKFKMKYYLSLFFILFFSFFILDNIQLIGWGYLFNYLWIISFIFVYLNISIIENIINIIEIKDGDNYDKEYLFASIEKYNDKFCFKYRLIKFELNINL